MDPQRINYLFNKRKTGEMFTAGEDTDWNQLMTDPDYKETVQHWMIELMQNNNVKRALDHEAKTAMLHRITRNDQANNRPAVHRIHLLRTAWFRYAAAILIMVGIGAYLWNTQQKEPIVFKPAVSEQTNIPPGTDKAILTLSDGKKIELNNYSSETITDGKLSIKNTNGQLIYSDAERGSLSPAVLPAGAQHRWGEEGGLNTMSTPRGGQYKLVLSDGTRVWLNAASSITFPTAFTQNIREVTITGEAYFEVSAKATKPFVVQTGKEQITVLGTSFNVSAYTDDPVSKTSLVTGAIKISNNILKPGEAFINGRIVKTDITQDIAWKNGIFNFQHKKLREVMRELARWYDLQVSYDPSVKEIEFVGNINRNLPLSQVLEGLQELGVHFILEEDRQLKIIP